MSRSKEWDAGRVLSSLQDYIVRNGVPTQRDCKPEYGLPSLPTIRACCGSLSKALAELGHTPKPGHRYGDASPEQTP